MEQLRLIQAPVKPKRNIKVVRFGGKDPLPDGGVMVDQFKELIEECEDLYPGIDIWLRTKVLHELRTRTWRSSIVLYENELPAGVAVMRHGEKAKFCNMRIRPEYQGSGLGSILTNLVMAEFRVYPTQNIHFTIPAHLWESELGEFLREYKFKYKDLAEVQYRQRGNTNSDPELACAAPFLGIWDVVREKIAEGYENFILEESFRDIVLLMSVKPKFARAIIHGEKRIELRRKFDAKWQGSRVAIYASSWCGPRRKNLSEEDRKALELERSIVGEATVENVIVDTPQNIWLKCKDELGCTFEEFSAYTQKSKLLHALRLGQVIRYVIPIPIAQLQVHVNEELIVPQSYYCLLNKEKWRDALKWGSVVNANR